MPIAPLTNMDTDMTRGVEELASVKQVIGVMKGTEGELDLKSVEKMSEAIQDIKWGAACPQDVADCLEALKVACEKCTDGKALNHLWMKCLQHIIKESAGHPHESLRPAVTSIISLCMGKLDELCDKLIALLSTKPLVEAPLKGVVLVHFRFYSSQLVAIEKSFPGCALSAPVMFSRTFIMLKMLADPFLDPAWETTTQWRPRITVFETSVKISLEAPEWKHGSKVAFLRGLLAPDKTLTVFGRFSAACGILLNPPNSQEASLLASQCVRYVLLALSPSSPNALPADMTYAVPAEDSLPVSTMAAVAICVFCTHMPSIHLHSVEECLYSAVGSGSPLSFLVACEVWGYMRHMSGDKWKASAEETATKLLLGANEKHQQERLKHVLRVLWCPEGSKETLMEKLEAVNTVEDAAVLERLPRKVLQWLLHSRKSVWLKILGLLGAEKTEGDDEALVIAARMLAVVRLRPCQWEGAYGDKGCGCCEPVQTLTSPAVRQECTCPVLTLKTKEDEVAKVLKQIWKHAKTKINACIAAKEASPDRATMSAFEISSALLPIFPAADLTILVGQFMTWMVHATGPTAALAATKMMRRLSRYDEKIGTSWCPPALKLPKLDDNSWSAFVFLNNVKGTQKYLGTAGLDTMLVGQGGQSLAEAVLPETFLQLHTERSTPLMCNPPGVVIDAKKEVLPVVKRRRMDLLNGTPAKPPSPTPSPVPAPPSTSAPAPAEGTLLRDVLLDASRHTALSSAQHPELHAELILLLEAVTAKYKSS